MNKELLKSLAIVIGILLLVMNAFFIINYFQIRKQVELNTANVNKIIQFINASVQNAQEKTN